MLKNKSMKYLFSILLVLITVFSAHADSAKQVDFLLSGYRTPTSDKVLSGGKVWTFLDGTTTMSALWTDKDKGGNATNPVILDSTGKAEIYGDNIYKFRIYDSDDVFIEEIPGLEYVTGVPGEYETISDLRLKSGSVAGETATVKGYYTVGDGNGGPTRIWADGESPGFYIDDGGYVIVPDGGDGSAAWLWADNIKLYIELFGAKGIGVDDGTDTAAILAAIHKARETSSLIYAKHGDFMISERIFFGPRNEADINEGFTGANNICQGLIGEGPHVTKFHATTAMKDDVVFDLSGLGEKRLESFLITTDTVDTDSPLVGILTGRLDRPVAGEVTPNDGGKFFNLRVEGGYKVASYLSYATETFVAEKCRWWNEHNDALGTFVSTDDILLAAPTIQEAPGTELLFPVGSISNLQQRHVDCDYYLGSEVPTNPDAAMAVIIGSQYVVIDGGFFNNNTYKHDCVRVQGSIYPWVAGMVVQNSDLHQNVGSGLVLETPTIGGKWMNNSVQGTSTPFVIDVQEFANSFMCDYLWGAIHIAAANVNCDWGISNAATIEVGAYIKDGFIAVNGPITLTGTGPSTENNYVLRSNNSTRFVKGLHTNGAFNSNPATVAIESNMAGSDMLAVGTEYEFFNGSLIRCELNSDAVASFNYLTFIDNSVVDVEMPKNCVFTINKVGGGLAFKSPGGVRWRIVVSDAGVLSTVSY